MPNQISARVVSDSLTDRGFRMLTFKCVLPRIVLAELNTHRMLTRNLASSRAVRFKKAVQGVIDHGFFPIAYQKDHAGMQGTEYFKDKFELGSIQASWGIARINAIEQATRLNEAGLTKQLCNRLIEPFQYVTALISGTEWENFTALRAHSMAEIHIADLAYKILDAANASTPKQLGPGEWHLPMGDRINEGELHDCAREFYSERALMDDYRWFMEVMPEMQRKVAAGRLARISYETVGEDEKIQYSHEQDIKLANRLIESGHWSPFEHIARAMSVQELKLNVHMESYREDLLIPEEIESGMQVVIHDSADPENSKPVGLAQYGWSGNLRGFLQYRKMFPHENRRDLRLLKKPWIQE